MINVLNNPTLSEKTMLGFVMEKEQGDLFATQLLPERTTKNKAISWQLIKNTRGLAPLIREGSEETLTSLGYEEKTATVVEIREGSMLTEQSINEAPLRDIVKDHLTHLTDRNILRQENMIFSEIIKNAGTVYNSANWGSESSKPLDDILDIVATGRKEGLTSFDTMIVDPDRELELMKNKEVREVLLQSNPKALIEGANVKALGRIRGMDVWVANSVIDEVDGTVTPLLNGQTIFMKRGSETGRTMVRERLTVRRFLDPGKRAIRLQVFKTLLPIIVKPSNIAVLNHS